MRLNDDEPSERTLGRVLGGCNRQIAVLNEIITSMTPSETSSAICKTWMGLESFRKDAKIRETMAVLDQYRATLMLHMLSDLSDRPPQPEGTRRTLGSDIRIYDIPRRRVSHFVERKDLMQNLKGHVLGTNEGSNHSETTLVPDLITIAVLVGLGGQGKTQITLELASSAKMTSKASFGSMRHPRVLRSWTSRRSLKSFLSGSKEFQDAEELIAYVHQQLYDGRYPWMLISDNYDDPEGFPDVTSFFPGLISKWPRKWCNHRHQSPSIDRATWSSFQNRLTVR